MSECVQPLPLALNHASLILITQHIVLMRSHQSQLQTIDRYTLGNWSILVVVPRVVELTFSLGDCVAVKELNRHLTTFDLQENVQSLGERGCVRI